MRFLKEGFSHSDDIELEYDDLTVYVGGDEKEVHWVYEAPKESVIDFLIDKIPDTISDDEIEEYIGNNLYDLVDAYYNELLEYFREYAEEDARSKDWEEYYDYNAYWRDADREWEESGLDEGVNKEKTGKIFHEMLDEETISFTDKLFDTIMNKKHGLLPDLFGDSDDYPNEVEKDEGIIRINYKGNYYELRVSKIGQDKNFLLKENKENDEIELPYIDVDEDKVLPRDIGKKEVTNNDKEILLDDISEEEIEEMETLASNVIKKQNKTLVNVEATSNGANVDVSIDTDFDEDEPVVDYVNENISQTSEVKGETI